jgi:AcrR family transcriptional regulator
VTQAATKQRSAGRPRDDRIDAVVLEAAAEVYAKEGWSGFNFEVVAREAGVGKGALYRRWDSPEDLLIDAIHNIDQGTAITATPNLHEACKVSAELQIGWWISKAGSASYIRLQMDQASQPFLGRLYRTRVLVPVIEAFRAKIAIAVESGEIPLLVSPTLLFELLSGAIMTRMSSTPAAERRKLSRSDSYPVKLAAAAVAGAVAARQADEELRQRP